MIPFLLAMDADSLAPAAEAAAIASTAVVAQAADVDASSSETPSFPYASLQLGVGFPYNYNGSFNLEGSTIDTSLDLNTGFNGELALGYQFNRTRAELALGYGNYGVNNQTFDGERVSSGGELQVTTIMVNGYYDFPIYDRDGVKSRWSPYIGAGIGYANINAPGCANRDCFAGGSTNGFAYQGKLGLSYRVAERSFAFLEGGYMGATSGSIDGVDFDDFGAWRVNVGFRIGFGGAAKAKPVAEVQEVQPEPQVIAPAPAPAPAAEPAMPIRGLW